MRIIHTYLLITVAILGLYSCVGTKQMHEVTTKLQTMQSAQVEEKNKLTSIAADGESKLADRKIDSNINNRLTTRIESIRKEMDSINKEITNLQNLANNKKAFRKSYKNEVIPKLAQLDTFYQKYDNRLKIYLMMEDALNTANYVLFDLAAFFGPGLYSIPKEQEALAAQSFLPLIDSLVKFSNKYKDMPRTATLVVLGFADGQKINPYGALYDTLTTNLGKRDVTKEELNQELSELRAVGLIKQLTAMFLKKVPELQNFDQLKIEYIGQGKGEEYPMPSIKDYKEDDERRRIVLCYWAVLPNVK